MKIDSREIFGLAQFAKISSREILGKAQFAKINSREMSEKEFEKINYRENFFPQGSKHLSGGRGGHRMLANYLRKFIPVVRGLTF